MKFTSEEIEFLSEIEQKEIESYTTMAANAILCNDREVLEILKQKFAFIR